MSAAFKPDVSTLQIVEVGVSTAQKWVDKQSCDQGPFGRTDTCN
jgi:hypothetical protein